MKLTLARILPALLSFATLSLLPAFSTAQANAPQPQDAEVTFYSNASVAKAELPYSHHAFFYGVIFDGSTKIATMRHGRFVTFHLSPGPHRLSASYSGRHPAKNSQFPIDLVAGKSYFIRTEGEYKNFVYFELQKGRLDEVSCATAHAEAGNTKPLKEKHIAKGARSEAVALTSMPPCQ